MKLPLKSNIFKYFLVGIPNGGNYNEIMTQIMTIITTFIGFGMLESGCVSIKNEVNIMMKNVVDIVLGGK